MPEDNKPSETLVGSSPTGASLPTAPLKTEPTLPMPDRVLNLNPTDEELAENLKMHLEIGNRSFISEIMNIPLPKGLHGEWVGTDDFSQFHARMKGYVDGSEWVRKSNSSNLHSAEGIMQDTKFMVVEQWRHDNYLKGQQMLIVQKHGSATDPNHDQFRRQISQTGLSPMSDAPEAKTVGSNEINQAIKGK